VREVQLLRGSARLVVASTLNGAPGLLVKANWNAPWSVFGHRSGRRGRSSRDERAGVNRQIVEGKPNGLAERPIPPADLKHRLHRRRDAAGNERSPRRGVGVPGISRNHIANLVRRYLPVVLLASTSLYCASPIIPTSLWPPESQTRSALR